MGALFEKTAPNPQQKLLIRVLLPVDNKLPHGPIMLVQCFGKIVGLRILGYKIEVLRAFREKRGFDGSIAGITNGSGRKPFK